MILLGVIFVFLAVFAIAVVVGGLRMQGSTESQMADFDLDEARLRSPVSNAWGCCIDDFDFLWFATKSDLIAFLPRYYSLAYSQLEEDGERDLSEEIINLISRGDELSQENLVAINKALGSLYTITWWGHFADLVGGTSSFAVTLRSKMRDDGSDAVITEEEVEQFVDHIREYGC